MEYIYEYIKKVLTFAYHTFPSEVLVVQITWLLIPIFAVVSIGIVVCIYYFRYRLKKRERITAKMTPYFQERVVQVALSKFTESEKNSTYSALKQAANTRFRKNLLLKIIVDLHSSISGKPRENLEELFEKVGLKKLLMAQLRSSNPYKRIPALRTLIQMDYVLKPEKYIYPYLEDKNEILRAEMQLAAVELEGSKGLAFLKDTELPLPEWEQIRIIETLTNKNNIDFGDISPWVKSKNPSVILFALKLIKIYSLVQYKQEVAKLISHENDNVRRRALELVGKFKITGIDSQLNSLYQKSEEFDERVQILDVLNAMKSNFEEKHEFLKSNLIRDFDYKKRMVLNY